MTNWLTATAGVATVGLLAGGWGYWAARRGGDRGGARVWGWVLLAIGAFSVVDALVGGTAGWTAIGMAAFALSGGIGMLLGARARSDGDE